jgi:hypothetical protein
LWQPANYMPLPVMPRRKLTDPDRRKILLERAQACLTLADQIEKKTVSSALLARVDEVVE